MKNSKILIVGIVILLPLSVLAVAGLICGVLAAVFEKVKDELYAQNNHNKAQRETIGIEA